jgi:hypothetical protein
VSYQGTATPIAALSTSTILPTIDEPDSCRMDAFAEHLQRRQGSRSPVVDHIVPGSTGGDWLDDGNLVTACWPCNARKADFTLDQLRWQLLERDPNSRWDGLTSRYRDLWQVAGEPRPDYHKSWIAALVPSRRVDRGPSSSLRRALSPKSEGPAIS